MSHITTECDMNLAGRRVGFRSIVTFMISSGNPTANKAERRHAGTDVDFDVIRCRRSLAWRCLGDGKCHATAHDAHSKPIPKINGCFASDLRNGIPTKNACSKTAAGNAGRKRVDGSVRAVFSFVVKHELRAIRDEGLGFST
ncbi:MAG: hypothetical protein ACLT47_10175 [Sutterella wadsworthensis]